MKRVEAPVFTPVTLKDKARLAKYYRNCNYGICEYSVGIKLMWKPVLHACWAEAAGCLLIRSNYYGRYLFDYPVPGPEGDVEAALDAIEASCAKEGIPLAFSVVPESKLLTLLTRYPYTRVSNIRTWQDYIYRSEDIQLFAGRRYSGQRNHIKRFYAAHPGAEVVELGKGDSAVIDAFWREYDEEFSVTKSGNKHAQAELKLAKKMLRLTGDPKFRVGAMMENGRALALSLAEKCGDTLIIHIEKALYSCTGVYPAMVQAFAQRFAADCRHINREDDSGDRGLRTSKVQYGPERMGAKYTVSVHNELEQHVQVIPELKTERLTLTALTEEDIPAYNEIVLDEERNRLWGYDDVGGLKEPMMERSFFEVTKRDFEDHLAVNFAVRLDGKMIGEAVLYAFDGKGSAELGCRISRAFAGYGYGTEAFAAVASWALYGGHLKRVVAKCFHENTASYHMLSSCMKKCGEDGTFYYFEKMI